VSCSSTGNILEESVCDLLSEGEYIYDPKTGTCLPLYSVRCFPGSDPRVATCPMGKVAGCESNIPDPDDDLKSRRDYDNGSFREVKPKAYQCDIQDDVTVRCSYATDLTLKPGVVCSPCCKVKNDLPPSIPK